MTTKPVGLYIHIPFCVRKCNYCDFCSYPQKDLVSKTREAYLQRLVDEISSYRRNEQVTVDTVFFGGGTPSLLSVDELGKIFTAIINTFNVLPGAEITIEVNPGTLNEEKLLAYKRLGVNRLSFGLQSIRENELKKLGRIHGYADFLECYQLARDLGFDNISVDLMYGIPEQTVESFAKTLDAVISFAPEHISAYGLIIEEGTPFYRDRANLLLPTDDAECDMYDMACDRLRKAGYSHYEISNYAKDGRESRHNLHYWHSEEYIGVGVAAYSYFEGKRFSNPDNLADYLDNKITRKYEERSVSDVEFEYSMLAFRLSEGLSLSEYKQNFGKSFLAGREEAVSRLVSLGYMKREDDRLALTDRGFYVSNSILTELL